VITDYEVPERNMRPRKQSTYGRIQCLHNSTILSYMYHIPSPKKCSDTNSQ